MNQSPIHTNPQQSTCPPNTVGILTLPGEIRHQILCCLLRSRQPLSRITRVATMSRLLSGSNIKVTDYWRFEAGGRMNLHPSILSTCTQLYGEGYSILYCENVVLISIAMFGTCHVDVLGHWRFDDLLHPPLGSGLPSIGRFRNFQIHVYVSSPRDHALEENELASICADLASVTKHGRTVNPGVGSGRDDTAAEPEHADIGSLAVYAHDGSAGKSYSKSDIYEAMWLSTLEGLLYLKCRDVTIGGDVPSWLSQLLKAMLTSDPSQRQDFLSKIRRRHGEVLRPSIES